MQIFDTYIPLTGKQPILESPPDFGEFAMKAFSNILPAKHKEVLVVIHLSLNHEPCAVEIVSIGTFNWTSGDVRDVFRNAIVNGSKELILAHNHPSGNCEPSKGDVTVTKRMIEAGRVLDIEVKDSVVVSGKEYESIFKIIQHSSDNFLNWEGRYIAPSSVLPSMVA